MKEEKALTTEMASVTTHLDVLKGKGTLLEFQAEAIEVDNPISLADAQSILSRISDINKKITAFIKPVKKAFKLYVDSFGAGAKVAEGTIRGKINNYAAAEEQKRQIAEAALREQQARAAEKEAAEAAKIRAQQIRDNPVAPPPPPPPVFVPPPVRLSSTVDEGFRTYWKHQITDRAKVPEKYWLHTIDEKKIAADVTAQKENFKEPGIETYTEKKVVAG